jgi:hypothetical protein
VRYDRGRTVASVLLRRDEAGSTIEERRHDMKFMLMMHAPRSTGDWAVLDWPPEDLKAHIDFMQRFNEELARSGELAGAEGLASPAEAKLVRATRGGPPAVTDGPFPEAKEFLAGFWIVDCKSPERAYEIAARASAAPGPGGAPLYMAIEVRGVPSAADLEGGAARRGG